MPASSVRRWVGLGIAAATGLVAAYVDSRPGFDDTGLLVGLLVLGSAVGSFVGGVGRLWTAAFVLAAGLPVPVVELVTGGGFESIAALAFAAIGVAIGAVAAYASASAASART